jgi:hypothetical protein
MSFNVDLCGVPLLYSTPQRGELIREMLSPSVEAMSPIPDLLVFDPSRVKIEPGTPPSS